MKKKYCATYCVQLGITLSDVHAMDFNPILTLEVKIFIESLKSGDATVGVSPIGHFGPRSPPQRLKQDPVSLSQRLAWHTLASLQQRCSQSLSCSPVLGSRGRTLGRRGCLDLGNDAKLGILLNVPGLSPWASCSKLLAAHPLMREN